MLIAPIFHNSYLSPKSLESQNKQSDAASSGSSSTKTSEAPSNTKYNNIFKTAFNRGITFLTKIANSSGTNTPSTSESSTSKLPAESESNHDSSSSETPSDCSSPDSLKTEMIFFKPINREPKTPSSSTKPVLLRIPSIRSTASSTDRHISSPCPSPFFIPITPRRESAFTVVGFPDDIIESQPIVKPMPTKRRNIKSSPEKSENPLKRVKQETGGSLRNKRSREVETVVEKPKAKTKTETVNSRQTRSMDKKINYDEQEQQKEVAEFRSPTKSRKTQKVTKTRPKAPAAPVKKEVSHQLKQAKQAAEPQKRVTRSQSLKH